MPFSFVVVNSCWRLGELKQIVMDIPTNLSHKPIVAVDYGDNDAASGAGDAKFLSLGKATWNNNDYSAKIFRKTWNTDRWSRQSEELPFWRVIDLATLLIAFLNNKMEIAGGEVVDSDALQQLKEFVEDNKEVYDDRIEKLFKVLK